MMADTKKVKCPKRHEIEVLASSLHEDQPTVVKCNHAKRDGSLCGEVFEVEPDK